MRTKLNAFTLSEMVVVMVVSAIVMGIAFTVLTLVQKHLWSIQENFNARTEFNRLEQVLWVDSNKHSSLFYDSKQKQLQFLSPLGDTIYQLSNSDFVIRQKDTFNVKIAKATFFNNGDATNEDKIDAIEIQLDKSHGSTTLFVYKRNDAKYYLD